MKKVHFNFYKNKIKKYNLTNEEKILKKSYKPTPEDIIISGVLYRNNVSEKKYVEKRLKGQNYIKFICNMKLKKPDIYNILYINYNTFISILYKIYINKDKLIVEIIYITKNYSREIIKKFHIENVDNIYNIEYHAKNFIINRCKEIFNLLNIY